MNTKTQIAVVGLLLLALVSGVVVYADESDPVEPHRDDIDPAGTEDDRFVIKSIQFFHDRETWCSWHDTKGIHSTMTIKCNLGQPADDYVKMWYQDGWSEDIPRPTKFSNSIP